LDEYRRGNFPLVHAAEIDAMLDFDVPYFSCRLDTTELLGNRRTVIPDYFPRPHLDSLTESLRARCDTAELLSSSDYGLFNRSIIHQSMATTKRNNEQQRGSTFLRDRLAEGSVADRVGAIADYLVATQAADDFDPHYWVSPQPASRDGWVLDKARPTLMDGGGIAAFLHSASRVADVPGAADLALQYWKRSIEPTIDDLAERGQLSLFEGLASYQVLATVFNGAAWGGREAAVAACVQSQASAPAAEHPGLATDFTYGLSGIGHVLSASPTEAADPIWAEAAFLSRSRIAMTLQAQEYDGEAELAHGDVGMLLGLAAWTRYLQEEASSKAEHLLTKIRHRALNPRRRPARSGWCRGQHGALAASVVAHAMLGVAADDNRRWHQDRVEQLLSASRNRPIDRAIDITLCHGLAGEADALLTIGAVLELPELRALVGAHLCADIDHAMRTVGCTGGMPYGIGVPSYLLGLAGVGHVFTRLLTDEPSLLLAAPTRRQGAAA
jgi:lantibiotic modifying enzyme